MILDIYFRKPVFWDFLTATIITFILYILYKNSHIALPENQDSYSLAGDLTNITLTLSGFILTILTVLITFKDNTRTNENIDDSNVFNKFFNTKFYYETVRHLKNCIKSIVTVSAIGFFLKLFLLKELREYFFFFNSFGLIITILTIWRCLLILSKILSFQKDENG